MSQLQVKVTNKVIEADDIASFELVAVNGQPLPAFSAGAHIDVHVADGVIRQYSLCNPPHERHRYQIGILRDPNSRGGSVAMHTHIQVGDVLTIGEPKNLFALSPSRRTLLLAGGIGITPILCMAEHLAATNGDFTLHYCARAPERMAFQERIGASSFASRVHYHFDNGDDAQKLALASLIATPDTDTHIYVCGPSGFIEHVVTTAKALGWPDSHVHLEHFTAAPVDTGGDTPFDVKIASTGQVFSIPVGQSVIKILADNGIDLPMSCEQGICGTCLTGVLEGEPDHRDMYLTEEEQAANDQFTPCCSRAKSGLLVLDV